jgi:hypothetical protein
LFWSDVSRGQIERSDLSGNNRTVILSRADGLRLPTKLAVDYGTHKLYWLNSGSMQIGSANFDGSKPAFHLVDELQVMSAMTIHLVSKKTQTLQQTLESPAFLLLKDQTEQIFDL